MCKYSVEITMKSVQVLYVLMVRTRHYYEILWNLKY